MYITYIYIYKYKYKIICISRALASELGLEVAGAHMGEGFGFYMVLHTKEGSRGKMLNMTK